MTFIHAITMNKDIRFLRISKQGSKSMQKQTPQISPICEQIIQIGELYIRNHWQDQTQKKDLFDSGTRLNTSRRLTVNNDLDLSVSCTRQLVLVSYSDLAIQHTSLITFLIYRKKKEWLAFYRRKKVVHVWNDMKVSKWWQALTF